MEASRRRAKGTGWVAFAATLFLVVGIMWAGLNACLHLLAIGAYPAWSIIIMAIDGLVIYALTVYGGALSEA
jgi:hypothetical protein